MNLIPFNKPFVSSKEFEYLEKAITDGILMGNGQFTKNCQDWLEKKIIIKKALLTHSCTAGLEMSALLANIEPGDEIIMPSYTFVSTANAFVLRGGIPVFVDIRSDTLNIDENNIEQAVSSKTKAIVPVHYAGVGCAMDEIMDIANRYNLLVIEDAAQGVMSTYKGKSLGSIGDMAAISFHETKNVICGEGGALLINNSQFIERAEIIWEKGTNRSQFFRGEVDKYTWVDIGSSYLPSEINAAFLWAQLEIASEITDRRLKIWTKYHDAFAELEDQEKLRRPIIPFECKHNAHMYYLIMPNLDIRTRLIRYLKDSNINTVFHYVPLHSSPAGIRYGNVSGKLTFTENLSERLIRLPLWIDMREEQVNNVIEKVKDFFRQI
jgi:dTDP-4-amino-4,6-dideoxygalactose transaminase